MELVVRKIVTQIEETIIDAGKPLERVKKTVAVAAVIENPYAGQYVEDLFPMIDSLAPQMGKLLSPRLLELLDGEMEAFGKAAIVGLDGEVEHGAAITHTLLFGNFLRDGANATTLLPAVDKVAPAGALFDMPLKHITAEKTRSHYQSFSMRIEDAPRANEIVIALVGTNSGRPHPRIGDLERDKRILGLA